MEKKQIDKASYPQPPELLNMPCQDKWLISQLPPQTVVLFNIAPNFPECPEDMDYALLPDGKVVRLSPEDYREPEKRKYPDAVPLVWEEWLYGPDSDNIATLSVGEATVIAATGLKGNGKSETLAYLSAKALALGMPVWSNMAVKFWLIKSDGTIKLCQTLDLDWRAVLTLSKELERGAMVVDEVSYFASSRLSASVRNRIINAAVNQVRKRTLDFYCSVKFLRQIDVNIREELDAQIECTDVARTTAGQKEKWPKGCFIEWNTRDISGWSGTRNKAAESLGFDTLGEPVYKDEGIKKLTTLRFTWPIYNSYEVVDAATAFRKVRLDFEDTVITDKPPNDEVEDMIAVTLDSLKDNGYTEVSCDELRGLVTKTGLNINDKQFGKILKDSFGISRKRRNKENVYILDEE